MGYKISSNLCKIEVLEAELRPTEHLTYGHNLRSETIITRTAYKNGSVVSANTFAQNIVRGGKAPSPKKAKKEEM